MRSDADRGAIGSGPALAQGSVLGWNLAFSAGAAAAGAALVSPRFAAGVALGAAVELANFRSLWRSCEKILLVGGPGAGLAVASFAVRFGLLAVVIAGALWAGTHPAGLVVGLSMIVPAAVFAAWRARPPVLPAEAICGPPADDPSWDEWNPWLARERAPQEDDEA